MSTQGKTEYAVPQVPPPGAAIEDIGNVPSVFSPLKIKDMPLVNRFVVSPMCMYSSDDGFMTDWHLVHLGQYAIHGAGLVICEATAVTPNGRITPNCTGLWKDEQVAPMKRVNKFIHSVGGHVGIQLAHAGRKASTFPPFHPKSRSAALPEDGGWKDVVGPTSEAWSETFVKPNELSVEDIASLTAAFKDAAKRALDAEFDVIEIHAAHGYLIHQFLSPLSNKRSDAYGGSFENRARLLIEIVKAVQQIWPSTKPLFVRLSCTDWVDTEESWDFPQTIELSKQLYALGVDLIDCSSSGNSPKQQIPAAPGFQVKFAQDIRVAVPGVLTGAVGLITDEKVAADIVQQGKADLIFMAREYLRNPAFVKEAAQKLGVKIKWANQYERGRPRPKHEAF
ncbi:hypothetical protein DSO57_1009649 [Entomophthora muscae]|nr:hypothetical protein DSO57_1009649 [Entomophthora muscae]